MDEDEIADYLKSGEENVKTERLIKNWCQHARIERSGGVGLLEQMSNTPIGHMGVRCEYTPAGGMLCFDWKESFLNHYVRHCKTCQHRKPGIGLTMQPYIDSYEEKQERKETEQEERESQEAKALSQRRFERAETFDSSDPIECQICELLDAIDTDEERGTKLKFIDLAKLAPDAFNPKIVSFLKQQVDGSHFGLTDVCADVLLALPLPAQDKIDIALKTAGFGMSNLVAECLTEHAALIPASQIDKILPPLASRACPSNDRIGSSSRTPDPVPLIAVAKSHPNATGDKLTKLLDSKKPYDADTAAKLISSLAAVNSQITQPHQRSLLSKLLRHKHLLPQHGSRSSSYSLSPIRDAAVALFDNNPEESDKIIESLCKGADKAGLNEAARVYSGVLKSSYNAPVLEATKARILAFKRVLWMAIESKEVDYDDAALNFFNYTNENLVRVAATHIDTLMGAAAILSQKLELLGKPSTIETKPSGFEAIDLQNERSSIQLLQKNLIKWAFMAASNEGEDGVRSMLKIFEAIPDDQLEIRGNIVTRLCDLIVNTTTLNLVLPHLYTALTHSNALIRGNAAKAVGEAHYSIADDFPSLVYEVYVALLTDPYVHVHKSAARNLKSYVFPEALKANLKLALSNLILAYARTNDDDEFLVQCIIKFVSSFLTESEIEGNPGRALVDIIGGLNEMHATDAIERMSPSLKSTPGFTRLVAKYLDSDWTNRVGYKEIYRALFHVPARTLSEISQQLADHAIQRGNVNPYHAADAIVLLARGYDYQTASDACKKILKALPITRENSHARAYIEQLSQISEFEAAIATESASVEAALTRWEKHLAMLEKLKEEDDDTRDFRPVFLS